VPAALALLIAALASWGCYAKHFPLEEEAPSSAAAPRLAWTAGVMVAEAASGQNVRRINVSDVAERFARRLEAADVFERVVFPYTKLSPVAADVVFEISVRSRVDLKWWQNLVYQAAVGASLLLLQPVLPTQYDLWIDLTARATAADAGWVKEHHYRGVYRFEHNRIQARESEVQAWNDDATVDAAEQLVRRIAGDRELRALAAGRAPPWSARR
jgi:hypothetical protein